MNNVNDSLAKVIAFMIKRVSQENTFLRETGKIVFRDIVILYNIILLKNLYIFLLSIKHILYEKSILWRACKKEPYKPYLKNHVV